MAGKKKKGNNISRIDRNKMVGPMRDFIRVENPEGADELGIIATFENNRYGVFLKKMLSDGFAIPGPDGRPQPMEIMHLIIVPHDKKKSNIPWEEKQNIKNQLLGPMSEAVELFPSEMRRMKTIAEHQTHLWVLPPGATMPLGLIPKAMEEMARNDALEKFTVDKDELELFVVEDGDAIQVFGSDDEARKSYEEAGNEMPRGKIGRIGDVPTEDTGSVWSDVAKLKVANVLKKSELLSRLMNTIPDEEDPEVTKVDTNGPCTDQDELEDEHNVGDHAPNSDEENVMMPEYMKMGVDNMRKERMSAVDGAVKNLTARMEADEEAAKKSDESESKAKDELAEMREQMKRDRAENDSDVN